MATLTVQLETISPVLKDADFTRYLISGLLYTKGILSGEGARELTGEARRVFEDKMSEYDFAMMPDDDDEIRAELDG